MSEIVLRDSHILYKWTKLMRRELLVHLYQMKIIQTLSIFSSFIWEMQVVLLYVNRHDYSWILFGWHTHSINQPVSQRKRLHKLVQEWHNSCSTIKDIFNLRYHNIISYYSGTCLIQQTKEPGKCVGLYRMSEYSDFSLVNKNTLWPYIYVGFHRMSENSGVGLNKFQCMLYHFRVFVVINQNLNHRSGIYIRSKYKSVNQPIKFHQMIYHQRFTKGSMNVTFHIKMRVVLITKSLKIPKG
jgi:hypothetical protein